MERGVALFLRFFYTFAHMALSRTRLIIGVISVVLLLSVGYGAFLLWGPSAKYRGLTTHIDVQMDESTRVYVQNQLKTSQASLAAAKANGEEIDLDLYAAVANNAFLLGDLVTAREALEAEMKGNPINYGARMSYGTVLEKMGDYDGARAAFEKALELSDGTAPESLFISLVELLRAHFPEDKEAVRFVLELSVKKQGQTSWNMVQLGRWYQAEGDCQRAIDHFSVAKTIAPTNKSIADDLQALKATCKI